MGCSTFSWSGFCHNLVLFSFIATQNYAWIAIQYHPLQNIFILEREKMSKNIFLKTFPSSVLGALSDPICVSPIPHCGPIISPSPTWPIHHNYYSINASESSSNNSRNSKQFKKLIFFSPRNCIQLTQLTKLAQLSKLIVLHNISLNLVNQA